MRSKFLIGGLLASVMLVPAALAQQANPPASPAPAATAPAPAPAVTTTTARQTMTNMWRASKITGLNVYNEQNEKLGDINEILLDPSGKVAGVVIGVGGFLGMGEHNIMVTMDKLKFVNEPVRTSSTTTTTTTTGAANAPARPATTTTTRADDRKWYPDHAVMSATKDQLKAMQAFKYN